MTRADRAERRREALRREADWLLRVAKDATRYHQPQGEHPMTDTDQPIPEGAQSMSMESTSTSDLDAELASLEDQRATTAATAVLPGLPVASTSAPRGNTALAVLRIFRLVSA